MSDAKRVTTSVEGMRSWCRKVDQVENKMILRIHFFIDVGGIECSCGRITRVCSDADDFVPGKVSRWCHEVCFDVLMENFVQSPERAVATLRVFKVFAVSRR